MSRKTDQDYCVICQCWTTSHANYNCPCLTCKRCSKDGHLRRFCPEQIKQEPGDFEKHQDEMIGFVTGPEFETVNDHTMLLSKDVSVQAGNSSFEQQKIIEGLQKEKDDLAEKVRAYQGLVQQMVALGGAAAAMEMGEARSNQSPPHHIEGSEAMKTSEVRADQTSPHHNQIGSSDHLPVRNKSFSYLQNEASSEKVIIGSKRCRKL